MCDDILISEKEAMDHLSFLPRPFTCETCGKTCESAKDLRFHVAQHKWGPHKVIHTEDGGMIFQCLNEVSSYFLVQGFLFV